MEDSIFKIDVNYLEQLYDMICSVGEDSFEDDLMYLKSFIQRLKSDFQDKSSFGKRVMSAYRDNIYYYELYKKYYIYIRKLLKSNLVFSDTFKPKFREYSISNKDALDLAREFYSKQDPFFSECVEDYVKEDANDHLEFIEPNDNTDGEMLFVESTGDAFVIVPDHKNMTKVSILVHELEHVIDCFNNPKFYKNRIIRECASMFMELVSTNYIGNVLNIKNDPELRRLTIHYIVKREADFLFFKNQILYLGNKYKELNSKGLNRIIKYYGYTDYDISKLNETCLINDYYYQISYLIAIELYNIYIVDKDKALYILKDIIMNGNDSNILEVLKRHNIELNNSVIDYEEELSNKLK